MKNIKLIISLLFIPFLISCTTQKKKEVKKPVKARKDVRILCTGDLMLDWGVRETVEKMGAKYLFANITGFLKEYDFRFCNLENPISDRGEPNPQKKYIFLANPDLVKILNAADINIVSLANNHSYDYGEKALLETMTNLYKSGINFSGAGMNIGSAHLPVSFELRKNKVALFSYTAIADEGSLATDTQPGIAGASLEVMKEDIIQFRKFHDFILVSIHWGIEYSDYPHEEQIDMAHELIDAGADVIIGHHPHIYQGIEIYKKRPIFYSLGNYLFGSINEDIRDNIVVGLRLLKGRMMSFSVYAT